MTEKIMEGKTCMITGASTGIGKQTACNLASMGAHVVICTRNKHNGQPALAEIKSRSGSDKVELLTADLSSQQEVRDLADAFKAKHERLHVLINNAGIVPWKHKMTVDGQELAFAVNHLAPFLLTNLLLDRLKASAPARVVNVTSGLHKMASIDFDDLKSEKKFGGFHAYNEAKLGLVLFTYELARRLEGTGVTVNTVHPGVIKSELGRYSPWYMRIGTVFFKSIEQGAETPTWAATAPEIEKVTGKYFIKKQESQSSKESYDVEIAKKLWDVSEQLVAGSAFTPDSD